MYKLHFIEGKGCREFNETLTVEISESAGTCCAQSGFKSNQ